MRQTSGASAPEPYGRPVENGRHCVRHEVGLVTEMESIWFHGRHRLAPDARVDARTGVTELLTRVLLSDSNVDIRSAERTRIRMANQQ